MLTAVIVTAGFDGRIPGDVYTPPTIVPTVARSLHWLTL
jgi:hypothetical protein